MSELRDVMDKLIKRELLEPKHKDHQLGGNNMDFRECHVRRRSLSWLWSNSPATGAA
jgi:addiction module RelE/StbE family toxin